MSFSIREQTEGALSEINVTPLVDVMLVLLIIFMVTAPMLSSSVEVNLQEASIAPPTSAEDHLIVSVRADGVIFVADQQTNLAILSTSVQDMMRQHQVSDVAIRGDKAVPYGRVLEVLDRLRAAKISGVGLVMDPPEPTGDSP